MKSVYRSNLVLTVFGASHAECVGMTLDGLQSGIPVDTEKLQEFLLRRAPGRYPWSTARREPDVPVFTDGLSNGLTTGAPLTAVIRNTDVRNADYAAQPIIPRPGHADYPAYLRYPDDPDACMGGGFFSGRMTAPLCIAGGICLQILEHRGITVRARILSIHDIRDDSPFEFPVSGKDFPCVSDEIGDRMVSLISSAKADGDSVGGTIECIVEGVPAGTGSAMFGGLENRISQLIFAIPAVKAVSFGDGFESASRFGSENNDAYHVKNGAVCTETNHCGGILGGLADGMPVRFTVAVKPTPSIFKTQSSVNLATMEDVPLTITGRHDPCIVPRAVPCIEAAAALAVLDALMDTPLRQSDLSALRMQIDRCDRLLLDAFTERMRISGEIGQLKKEKALPVLDEEREKAKTAQLTAASPEDMRDSVAALYEQIFSLSRKRQSELQEDKNR